MRFFKILHFLSLDVVICAVPMNVVFYQHFIGSLPPWQVDLLLAISVYLIYGIDRQIDNSMSAQRDELHAFHYKHQLILRIMMVPMLFILGLFLLHAEIPLIAFGVGLSFMLVFYWYGWIKRLFDHIWGSKELFTALIYSLGVMLPTMANAPYSILLLGVVLEVFSLALLNLGLFTLIETGGHSLIWKACCLIALLGLFALGMAGMPLGLLSLFVFIWGFHVGIYYFRASKPERYVGDLAFLSPLIYLVCHY